MCREHCVFSRVISQDYVLYIKVIVCRDSGYVQSLSFNYIERDKHEQPISQRDS